MAGVTIPQVKRRTRRDVEQLRIFLLAFHLGMRPAQRILKIMTNVLVELLVLLVGNIGLAPGPQRIGLVNRFVLVRNDLLALILIPFFLFHHDRQGDVVGILADNRFQLPGIEEIILTIAQMQDRVGTAPRLLDHLDRVIALARRLPANSLICLDASTTRNHGHLVGNDE